GTTRPGRCRRGRWPPAPPGRWPGRSVRPAPPRRPAVPRRPPRRPARPCASRTRPRSPTCRRYPRAPVASPSHGNRGPSANGCPWSTVGPVGGREVEQPCPRWTLDERLLVLHQEKPPPGRGGGGVEGRRHRAVG